MNWNKCTFDLTKLKIPISHTLFQFFHFDTRWELYSENKDLRKEGTLSVQSKHLADGIFAYQRDV